jgi:hypothetical protein
MSVEGEHGVTDRVHLPRDLDGLSLSLFLCEACLIYTLSLTLLSLTLSITHIHVIPYSTSNLSRIGKKQGMSPVTHLLATTTVAFHTTTHTLTHALLPFLTLYVNPSSPHAHADIHSHTRFASDLCCSRISMSPFPKTPLLLNLHGHQAHNYSWFWD